MLLRGLKLNRISHFQNFNAVENSRFRIKSLRILTVRALTDEHEIISNTR